MTEQLNVDCSLFPQYAMPMVLLMQLQHFHAQYGLVKKG